MVEQIFRHTFDRSNVSVSKTGKLSWPFNVFPELCLSLYDNILDCYFKSMAVLMLLWFIVIT